MEIPRKFVHLSPIPVVMIKGLEPDSVNVPVGPLSLEEATRFFWKFKNLNLNGNFNIKVYDTTKNPREIMIEDSVSFNLSSIDKNCVASKPPHYRATTKYNEYEFLNVYDPYNGVRFQILGPFYDKTYPDSVAFENRKFCYFPFFEIYAKTSFGVSTTYIEASDNAAEITVARYGTNVFGKNFHINVNCGKDLHYGIEGMSAEYNHNINFSFNFYE